MPVRVVSPRNIPVQEMPGRKLQWLVTSQTLGTEKLSMCLMDCPPGATVRPLHAHRDTEEVIYILEGSGEVWVDGEVAAFEQGDAVFFPANSKHMTRNTGTGRLVAVCMFSPPTTAASYVLYDTGEGW
jgi:quercetin dioxygenase-like cupin family protein